MDYIWRAAVAAFAFWAFVYLVPLFLSVLEISVDGNLWQLIKALAGFGAIAYVFFGRQSWPWRSA